MRGGVGEGGGATRQHAKSVCPPRARPPRPLGRGDVCVAGGSGPDLTSGLLHPLPPSPPPGGPLGAKGCGHRAVATALQNRRRRARLGVGGNSSGRLWSVASLHCPPTPCGVPALAGRQVAAGRKPPTARAPEQAVAVEKVVIPGGGSVSLASCKKLAWCQAAGAVGCVQCRAPRPVGAVGARAAKRRKFQGRRV